MKELYEDLRAALERYYDNKLKNSGYYNDQEIWDKIEDFIYDIQNLADDQTRELDNILEDLEADYMPTRTEMMDAYDRAREDALVG
jgi:hypothetical protein